MNIILRQTPSARGVLRTVEGRIVNIERSRDVP